MDHQPALWRSYFSVTYRNKRKTRLSPWSGKLVSFHFSGWLNFVQHLLPAGSSSVLVPLQVLPEWDLQHQCQHSVKCPPQALTTVSSALKFRKASGLVAVTWAPQGPVFSLLFSLSGPEPESKFFWTAWRLPVTAMAVGIDTALSAGRSSRKLAQTCLWTFPSLTFFHPRIWGVGALLCVPHKHF